MDKKRIKNMSNKTEIATAQKRFRKYQVTDEHRGAHSGPKTLAWGMNISDW